MMNYMNNFSLEISDALFVGDLSVTCVETDLHELFSPFGEVRAIRIMKTRKQTSLGYAFVTMGSVEQATLAMESLNGVMLCGRHLRIGYATDPAPKKVKKAMSTIARLGPLGFTQNFDAHEGSSSHQNSVFFRFSFPKVTDALQESSPTTDEGVIRSLFDEHCGEGAVVDVSIRRVIEDQGDIKGYGFIHFKGIDECVRALELLSDVEHNGVHYTLEMSKNLQKQLTEYHMTAELPGSQAHSHPTEPGRGRGPPLYTGGHGYASSSPRGFVPPSYPSRSYHPHTDRGYRAPRAPYPNPRGDHFSGPMNHVNPRIPYNSYNLLSHSMTNVTSGPSGFPYEGRNHSSDWYEENNHHPGWPSASTTASGPRSTLLPHDSLDVSNRGTVINDRDHSLYDSLYHGPTESVSEKDLDLGLPDFPLNQTVFRTSQQPSLNPSLWPLQK